MKRSCGILTYRRHGDQVEVLLCHPGGPYWVSKEEHAYSIPKGEGEKGEAAIATALREFNEETNLIAQKEKVHYLTSKKVSNKKMIIIFVQEQDYNLEECKSNSFELEWPKESGQYQSFPECDRFIWVGINRAKELVFKQQVFFIERLEQLLRK